MSIRVGINGFGRIGRLMLRAAWGFDPIQPGSLIQPNGVWGKGAFEIVHINEIDGGIETAAHLLKFDCVHGTWPVDVAVDGRDIHVGDRTVGFSEAAHGIELVLECTGKFKSMDSLTPYFSRGVKKVVVSAPVKEPDVLNVVMGVNDNLYDPKEHNVLTAASCTTNCLAPVVKVVHEGIGIRHGSITTIHDVTNTQMVVDGPHKDLRRARSSLINLIPTSTGSATAIGIIYPELQGKLNGLAVRVPLLNASLTDCVFEVARNTSAEEVNSLIKAAADGPLAGILGYEARPLVSTDFLNDARSSIVEYGYGCRMAELADKVAASLGDRQAAAE